MQHTYYILAILFFSLVSAQNTENDTINDEPLKEIVVFGNNSQHNQKNSKPLANIDEYLQESNFIRMIRRGSYANEPLINSMTTERSLITIDGMRIFGACTDKMDPVTSYVEISNLKEATISSGQEGACHGATIGGGIDLKTNRSGFSSKKFNANAQTGYETNAQQKIAGVAIDYAGKSVYSNSTFMYRNAENYKAGGNKEILYSQFTKYNFSANLGLLIDKDKSLEGSLIYDKAIDVGYPALTMDVSSATALITSVLFSYKPKDKFIENWDTKAYYNTITHIMDDTKRAYVPVHMDMPGWSDTYGFFSMAKTTYKKHRAGLDVNSFYNKSLAEMTMYPTDPTEKSMYMLTWPNVSTKYIALSIEDVFTINKTSNLKINANIASHTNEVKSQMGLESLQIFYYDMSSIKTRFLKSIAARYLLKNNGFECKFGMAYGDRAPSVTEGYGFYLFNSSENYDYIGNPNLADESSLEASFSAGFSTKKTAMSVSSSYFRIYNYIIGITDYSLSAMTIGAKGVKVYSSLDYANIYNVACKLSYQIISPLNWNGKLTYSYGRDFRGENLPYISPISFETGLVYNKAKFLCEIAAEGNATQTQYSTKSGEDGASAYTILNLSAGYIFPIGQFRLTTKVGAENILDKYYSTFSDWNNIPRMGRNVYLNIDFKIKNYK